MQLMLIFGIIFAIGSVTFALQNNIPVTVTFAVWRFDSSLAMVLLLALGLGATIAALLSSPAVIRRQWNSSRLRRQLASLEEEKAMLERRAGELEIELARLSPASVPELKEEKPYVGLKALLTGATSSKSEGG